MKKLNTHLIIAIGLLLIPWIYLLCIYGRLPEIVPTHFDAKGLPDDYSHKRTLIFAVGLLTSIALGVFFLLRNIRKFDPKKSAAINSVALNKMSMAIVLFIAFLSVMIVSSALYGGILISKLILPMLGLFFAYLGNLMFSLKPNYFAGIRLPWTLENEDNWRKTHQLGGKMWFAGGLLITLTSLILEEEIANIIFIAIMVIITIVPTLYSFTQFKNQQKTNS